ncbi:MAG: ribonuclease P protein component [Rhodovibrionaceae bacterium]|nr:ribonuclease P protein component [Rhodovibrionaceae bacterium]
MPRLGRLKTRPEFLRVAAARRKAVRPGVIVQARRRKPEEDKAATGDEAPVRFGLTASRKVGGAVVRNRARRRLRAAAEAILPERGQTGVDYVLIARAATVTRSFPDLLGDLEAALAELHRRQTAGGNGGGRPQQAKGKKTLAMRQAGAHLRRQEREGRS